MHSRIKELRLELGLSQQKFADKLGIARGNIAAYEVNKNAPSDAVISLICEKCGVSEDWLRFGEGEMFCELSRSEVIAGFAGDLMKDEEDSFRRRFIEALAQLNESEWELLADIATKMAKKE